MPDVVHTPPSFSVHQDETGTVAVNLAVPGASLKGLGVINWAALIQAIVAAVPSILAIIAAFSSTPAPPSPLPPAEK